MTIKRPFRLATSAQPKSYKLTLTPDLKTFTFAGEEEIELSIHEPQSELTLNAADLDVAQGSITIGGSHFTAKNIEIDEKAETVTFRFEEPIPIGPATLSVRFNGILNDQLRGFYRSQYTTADGHDGYLATTQFEATDARRAFPCWDDPAVKATFEVTLIVPSTLVAISNMPIASESSMADGKKAVQFAESPRMSTYLLAFIVGDFASVEEQAPNGTLMRVWSTRGSEEQGRFALENSIKLLTYFNDYFGIPYPLEKLDHIAIPDFAAGAMENWGAITYRETALLYDPANSAANTRQRILEIVAHEMAHMWFGDLVTMEWWDDLWLNESFASWMGDKAVDALYPEWNMWTQFVYQDTNVALSLDGLRNSHPIEANVKDPSEIRELFDAISYSKGGATLRMLEEFLGPDIFQQGLRAYLSANEYDNARTEDLWSALDEASGHDVTALMNTWVKQMGYPLLEARINRSEHKTSVHLSQQRFLYDHMLETQDADKSLWRVPVTIIASSAQEKSISLMTGKEADLSVETPSLSEWAKVNAAQTGFYRVNYEPAEWERLRSAVARLELPATDRLGLQNDAYALMRAGFTPAIQFLSLTEPYCNEDDASVWSDLSANLKGMESLLCDEDYLAAFKTFAGGLYEKIVSTVGWDAKPKEGHLDSIRRSTVLGQSGSYGNPYVLEQAQQRFESYRTSPDSLHPDLRGIVLNLAAEQGGRASYDEMWRLAAKAPIHEEKVRILGALTRFKNKTLLQETLERSLSDEVRSQDSVPIIVALAGNRMGRDLAWEFLKANWAELDRRYGQGGFAITRLVAITSAFTTPDKATDVEQFFEANPAPSATRTIQQSLERIRLNCKWLENNRQSLRDWFAAKG